MHHIGHAGKKWRDEGEVVKLVAFIGHRSLLAAAARPARGTPALLRSAQRASAESQIASAPIRRRRRGDALPGVESAVHLRPQRPAGSGWLIAPDHLRR